jgi:flavodoxin
MVRSPESQVFLHKAIISSSVYVTSDSMKPFVLYSSRSGNTKKIAEAVTSELNCTSLRITNSYLVQTKDLSNYDLFFVGSGVRFGNPNEEMISFLETLRFEQPKVFALFLTWGGAGKTDLEALSKLKSVLESKDHRVVDDCFSCYGGRKFSLLKRGHPKDEDMKAAAHWAKRIIDKNK